VSRRIEVLAHSLAGAACEGIRECSMFEVARVACTLAVLGACASSSKPAQDPVAASSSGGAADTSVAAKPRPRPPTPESVTIKQPGGDAEDPQQAALLRLIETEWGVRSDKDDQLLAPLPDRQHWKRVRYWGVEHFVGFRYGNDHHALVIGFVQDVPDGTAVTTDTCMRRFEAWGRPQTRPFAVKFSPFQVSHQRWRDQRLEVHAVDGEFAAGFSTTHFSAAWAAYPAYRDACLVYAVAVPWRNHPELARQARDRFVTEGFTQLAAATEAKPVRK
jgi:hypothetical protein